jgi:hypothetical protein
VTTGSIRIEGLASAERVGKIELRGTYGELLEHPISRIFSKTAPGDHVKASIRGFGLHGGDRVSVEGEVTDEVVASSPEDPGAEGGLREAPKRVPGVVRATRIAIGKNPEATLDKASLSPSPGGATAASSRPPAERAHKPMELSTAIYAGLGLPLVVGSLVIGWSFRSSPRARG